MRKYDRCAAFTVGFDTVMVSRVGCCSLTPIIQEGVRTTMGWHEGGWL